MKKIHIVLLSFLSLNIIAQEQNSAFYAITQKNTQALENFLKTESKDLVNEDGQTILHAAVLGK